MTDVVVTVTLMLTELPAEPVAVSVQLPAATGLTTNDPPVTALVATMPLQFADETLYVPV